MRESTAHRNRGRSLYGRYHQKRLNDVHEYQSQTYSFDLVRLTLHTWFDGPLSFHSPKRSRGRGSGIRRITPREKKSG